jgi:hypothetical protein
MRGARQRLTCYPAAWLLAAALCGCAHRPPPGPPPDCAAVSAQVGRQVAAWQGRSVTGVAAVVARDGLLRRATTAALVVAPPDRLRLEAMDAFGQTRLLGVLAAGRVAFWTPEGGWRWQVPPEAAVGLPAVLWPQLPRLLLGLPCSDAICEAATPSPGGDLILLGCVDGSFRYRWDPRDHRVVEAFSPALRIRYKERGGAAAPWPPDLDITMNQGRSLSLRWQQLQLDRPVAGELFLPGP